MITLQGVIVETVRRPWRRKEAFMPDKMGFAFVQSPVPGDPVHGGSVSREGKPTPIGWGSSGSRLPVFPKIHVPIYPSAPDADPDGRSGVVIFTEVHTVTPPQD